MIDPTRQELLKLIEALSEECPEYRFGQLVMNLAFMAREDGDRRARDVEDTEFVEAASTYLADWSSRQRKSDDASRQDPALTRV